MLVLSRSRESVVIGGSDSIACMKVTVLEVPKAPSVRLGFEVDADIPRCVHRSEVWDRIQAEEGRRAW